METYEKRTTEAIGQVWVKPFPRLCSLSNKLKCHGC